LTSICSATRRRTQQIGSSLAKEGDDTVSTGESPNLHAASSDLDFTLDAPERGADESPTREMPPRDEPTVESELMSFTDAPTTESPALKSNDVRDRISSKLGAVKADQTAEVSIDDLGLDLDQLEETGEPSSSHSHLEETIIRPMRRPWWPASMKSRGA